MKYHRERVCMQRAIRRIIERKALLTNMPIVLREQALKDADKLLSLRKGRTINSTLLNHVDILAHLRLHFWDMCAIANYQFSPRNFDHGIAVCYGQEPPAQSSVSAATPKQELLVKKIL